MGCSCSIVESSECPKNYYCPQYTYNETVTYKTMLEENKCTITQLSSNVKMAKVTCPCPPGFYCPENSVEPVYCCEGFYCPSDPSATNADDKTGLGSWGGVVIL